MTKECWDDEELMQIPLFDGEDKMSSCDFSITFLRHFRILREERRDQTLDPTSDPDPNLDPTSDPTPDPDPSLDLDPDPDLHPTPDPDLGGESSSIRLPKLLRRKPSTHRAISSIPFSVSALEEERSELEGLGRNVARPNQVLSASRMDIYP